MDSSVEPANDILMNIDQLAYTNLDKERNTRWIGQDGRKAAKMLQCGMQYYMFVQKQMREKLTVLQQYTEKQESEMVRLQQVYLKKKATHKSYRELNEKLNDQALHYEIMINRLRPDLLEKATGEAAFEVKVRPDVRRVDSNIH